MYIYFYKYQNPKGMLLVPFLLWYILFLLSFMQDAGALPLLYLDHKFSRDIICLLPGQILIRETWNDAEENVRAVSGRLRPMIFPFPKGGLKSDLGWCLMDT